MIILSNGSPPGGNTSCRSLVQSGTQCGVLLIPGVINPLASGPPSACGICFFFLLYLFSLIPNYYLIAETTAVLDGRLA